MKELIDHASKKKKLYSQNAIAIATFLGSPLAGSILIKHNYDALSKETIGKISLAIGIVSTLLIFGLIFVIPEGIIDQVPQQIIPGIYTLIVYFLVEKFQGEDIKLYENEGLEFESYWKAAGIGLVIGLIVFGGFLAAIFLDPVTREYDNMIDEFAKNEKAAIEVYDKLYQMSTTESIAEINDNSIPLWEKNIKLLDDVNDNMKLTTEMKDQNKSLEKYCKLRIEQLGHIKSSILLNTMSFDFKIDSLNKEMNKLWE